MFKYESYLEGERRATHISPNLHAKSGLEQTIKFIKRNGERVTEYYKVKINVSKDNNKRRNNQSNE